MEIQSQRDLFAEVIKLRQESADKVALEELNQEQMTLIATLEVKISELEIQLEAKDAQIYQLTEKSWNDELSPQLTFLQEENKQLKELSIYREKFNSIQGKLTQAVKTKDQYEEKYKDVLRKLSIVQNDDTQNLLKENNELREKCQILAETLETEREKYSTLKDNMDLTAKLKSPRMNSYGFSQVPTPSGQMTPYSVFSPRSCEFTTPRSCESVPMTRIQARSSSQDDEAIIETPEIKNPLENPKSMRNKI